MTYFEKKLLKILGLKNFKHKLSHQVVEAEAVEAEALRVEAEAPRVEAEAIQKLYRFHIPALKYADGTSMHISTKLFAQSCSNKLSFIRL